MIYFTYYKLKLHQMKEDGKRIRGYDRDKAVSFYLHPPILSNTNLKYL